MRQNAGRGGLQQFPTPLLSLSSFLLSETQEVMLLSGIVDFPAHLIAYIRGGSIKFRHEWPGHLSAI